jgi:hypothetical protein
VYFTAEQRERLDALARRGGKTVGAVVREAVDAYISESSPGCEDVLDESFGSMPDFEACGRGTGLVATAEAVVDTDVLVDHLRGARRLSTGGLASVYPSSPGASCSPVASQRTGCGGSWRR